jgi:small-conductance mechanosensitive channel
VISIVIIVVAFLAWFIVKDFIAGIVFKVQSNLQLNNTIQVGNVSGIIKSLHPTYLKLETSTGQMVKVPYSRLNHEIISEISEAKTKEGYKFQLQIRKIKGKQETEDRLNFLIINSAWSNYNRKPILKLVSENDTHYTFEVTASTLNHKHMWLLEKSVREQLEKN